VIFSDQTAPDGPARDIHADRRKGLQRSTARTAEATSIGAGGIVTKDGGRIEAQYTNGGTGVLFGEVPQGSHPEVPHGTGLYVWSQDGVPMWWVTHASDGRTEMVTGTDEIPIERIWYRVGEFRNTVHGVFNVQTVDGANLELLSDGRLWLYADGNCDMDVQGDLDIDVQGTAQISSPTLTQILSGGDTAIGGSTGVFLQPESGAGVANMRIDTVTGRVTYIPSTARAKRDIQDLSVDVETVLRLRPRTWLPGPGRRHCPEWLHTSHKDPAECCDGQAVEPPENPPREVGFVAEELDELGLSEFVEYDTAGLPASIRYDRITAALVPLLQRQQAQIDALAEQVQQLATRVAAQEHNPNTTGRQ
jgi:hypothetical protein